MARVTRPWVPSRQAIRAAVEIWKMSFDKPVAWMHRALLMAWRTDHPTRRTG